MAFICASSIIYRIWFERFGRIISCVQSIPKVSNREAGEALPTEIIAVVRPRLCKHRGKSRELTLEAPRLEQKFIIAEAMEMKLVVRGMKYHSLEVIFSRSSMEEAEFKDEAIISASTIGTLKGLYIFNTKKIESIIKNSGTYFFFLTLVCILSSNMCTNWFWASALYRIYRIRV